MRKSGGRRSSQKGRILDLARELFFRYGFTRVTVDEIVAELHISKATFYKSFRSKEDLLEKVISAYYGTIRDGITQIMTVGREGYLTAFRTALVFVGEKLRLLDERVREDIRSNAPATWRTVQELQRNMVHAALETTLEKGIRLGIVRRDTDTRLVTDIMVVTIQGVLSSGAMRSMALSMEKALQGVVDVFADGILSHDTAD